MHENYKGVCRLSEDSPKGRLFFIEEWAKKKKYKDAANVFMGIVVVIMGLIVIAMALWMMTEGEESSATGVLFLFTIGFVVAGLGFAIFAGGVKRAPFKIYENGFTLPNVDLKKGLWREEVFIPWSRLQKATIDTVSLHGVGLRRIKLVYDDNKSISLDDIEDPFRVIKLLKRLVPEKLDSTFKVYVGSKKERAVVVSPVPLKPSLHRVYMPYFMGVFMLVVLGAVLEPKMLHSLVGIILLTVLLSVALFMFYMAYSSVKDELMDLIRYRARATERGIEIPTTFVIGHLRRVRRYVPYDEVKAVRMKLHPFFLSHEAEFETVAGERYLVPFSVYEKVSKMKNFRRKGYDYFNTTPAKSRGAIVASVPWRTALFFILPFTLLLLGPFLSLGSYIGYIKVIQMVFLVVVFLILLPLLLLAYWIMGKRNSLADEMFVHDGVIVLPRAPEKFRSISERELLNAEVKKDLFGYYLELQTGKGIIKLPQVSAEKLIAAGIEVKNADYVVSFAEGGRGKVDHKRVSEVPTRREKREVWEHLDPGALLLEEDQKTLEVKRRRAFKWGAILSAGGLIMMILPLLAYVYTSPGFVLLKLNLALLVIIGAVFLIFGVVLLMFSTRVIPVRIYENGIEFPMGLAGKSTLFVPYGRILSYTESTAPVWGEVIKIQAENNAEYVIPKTIPGLLDVLEEVKPRFGRPEYDSKDYDEALRGRASRLSSLYYVLSFVVGFIVVALNLWLYSEEFTMGGFVETLLLYGPPVTLLSLSYFFYSALKKQKGYMRFKLKTVLLLLYVSINLVLFAAGALLWEPEAERVTIFIDSPPQEYGYGGGAIENTTLFLTSNIYVAPGEFLRIENSTIVFNMTLNGEYGIYVDEGGRVEVLDSCLMSNNSNFGYRFEIHGEGRLENSVLQHLYGSESRVDGDGGLEIYSSGVEVINCTLLDCKSNGIIVVSSSPLIDGSTVRNCGDDGIEVQRATPVITNSTFENNGWAITVFPESRPVIRDCRIVNNSYGVTIIDTTARIENTHFQNNKVAVKLYGSAQAEMSGNSFQDNGKDLKEGISMDQCCFTTAFVLLLLGIVSLLAVAVKLKKGDTSTITASQD